jgi:FkbM family methyltransferase
VTGLARGGAWLAKLKRAIAVAEWEGERDRTDDDFPWPWYQRLVRPTPPQGLRRLLITVRGQVRRVLASRTEGYRWLCANAEQLESVRKLLVDEASQEAFDAHLLLQVLGPWRFTYRRPVTSPIAIAQRCAFNDALLADDYMGLPLEWFDVRLEDSTGVVQVLTTELQIRLLERFGQYFPEGAARVCRPSDGDVVLDCGSCVGDMSVLFAAAVGPAGRVIAFDPLPVHHRYLERQIEANPSLHGRITGVVSAVGDMTHDPDDAQSLEGVQEIQAGFRPDDRMRFLRLDDFVAAQGLKRVDLIKMDIEGSELAALRGAEDIIRRFRPRLAISAYHDRRHLVELPRIIREIEPSYRFAFAQHSPVAWEAVLYAWCDPGGALSDARTAGAAR